MAKLTRVTGKVFGSQASPTGDVDNGAYIGQFGSAQAGTYVGTDDVAMIQNLPAWEQGWIGACVEEDQLPPLPERTGVDKVLSYQECYLLQQGMPEWDSATTYYVDNFCSYNGIIYKSLTDINLNNQPDISVANWEVYGKISQYTKFAINKGNENLLINNSNELAFDVDNANTLTFTNINGETIEVDSLTAIDVSAENDGTYKVALPNTGNQPYLFNGTVYNQETEPLPDFQKKFTDYNFYVENNYIKIDDGGILAFPDGLNIDGSKKFVYKTMPYISFTYTSWGNGTTMPCVQDNSGIYNFYTYFDNQWYNQTTQPTVSGIWYNPETNIIQDSADGVTWTTQNVSLPIGRATFTSGTGFTALTETYQTPQVLWINPQEMYTAQLTDKVIGYGSWQDFNDVLLLDSSVTVGSGVISNLSQPTYNYNGIGLNQSSNTNIHDIFRKCSPDWNKGISKSTSGFTADEDGWLISRINVSNSTIEIIINDIYGIHILNSNWTGMVGTSQLIPINKGDVTSWSRSTAGTATVLSMTFYPLKGVN